MSVFGMASRVAARFSAERRELARLAGMPRGTRVTTSHLIHPNFESLDGGSLAAQYRQIFQQQAFLFQPGSSRPRIIDCGANVGVFTVYFKQRFPECSILAFEPDPEVFTVLTSNVQRCCGGFAGVDLTQAAVTGGTAPSVTFHADHCDAGRISTSLPGGTTIDVAAVRLRDYLQEGCDLLKLDIEGAEIEVLQDCADRLTAVERIFIEFHSFVGQPQRLDAVFGVLAKAGFRVFVQGGHVPRQPFVRRDQFLGMDMQLDIWGLRD